MKNESVAILRSTAGARQYLDLADSISSASRAMARFGNLLRQMRDEAFATDPGLAQALLKAQKHDPDIGWLDVAAARVNTTTKEMKCLMRKLTEK